MRSWVAGVALVVGSFSLSGCSPARTAVVGLGLDNAGQLVAAVVPCGAEDLTVAFLSTDTEQPVDLGSWERSSPLVDAERWRLRSTTDPAWRPVGPALPELDDRGHYTFGIASEDGGEQSNWLTFTGADLAGLAAGHVLVEREGPVDRDGNQDISLAVVRLDDLPDEHCGY